VTAWRSIPAGAALLGVVALVSGCGSSSSPSTGSSSSAAQAQASSDAAQLLATVQFPPGSRRSATQPPGGSALVRTPPSTTGPLPSPALSGGVFMELQRPPAGSTRGLASAWWVARGSIDLVVTWLQQHSPPGTLSSGASVSGEATATGSSGSHGSHSRTTSEAVDFSIAPSGHYALREILVGMVPGRYGTTIARVEAQSAWSATVTPTAKAAARIAAVRSCLSAAGLTVIGGGPVSTSGPLAAGQPPGLVGELLTRVTGSNVPVFIAFYTSADAAQQSRSLLRTSAKKLGGTVDYTGAEAVLWPHPPAVTARLRVVGCLH
jgi:hypothetical protein